MLACPTLHPAFLLRSADGSQGMSKFKETVTDDFRKALALRWRAPDWDESVIWEKRNGRLLNLFPDVGDVADFCKHAMGRRLTVDVETTGEHPLDCKLICIGMATDLGRAICVPVLRQYGSRYWHPDDEHRVFDFIRFLLGDPFTPKNFHNGAFDTVVLRAHGFPIGDLNDPWGEDTMQAHHVADGELPHGLAYCSSRKLEIPYWKDDVKGDIRWLDLPDLTLRAYNLRDCLTSDRLVNPLLTDLRKYGLEPLYREEIACASIMAGATVRGIEVDLQRRDDPTLDQRPTIKDKKGVDQPNAELGRPLGLGPKLRLDRATALAKLEAITGPGFNPRSQVHLRYLLFNQLKLPVVSKTEKGGQPSTDKNAMILLALHASTQQQMDALEALIKFRKADKMLGTWVDGLTILSDNRLHTNWKLLPVTGRFSSSPNAQNWNAWIKRIFKAALGYKLVSIDLSQAELRVIAYLANDDLLLKMYQGGINVHTANTCMLFQVQPPAGHKDLDPQTEAFLHEMCPVLLPGILPQGSVFEYAKFPVLKSEGKWKASRTLAKNFVFGDNYGAEATTLFEVIRAKRDPDTDAQLFPHVTLGQIEGMKLLWEKMHHWIPVWWRKVSEHTQRQKFYRCPLSGRIRFFRGGFKRNEMLNFPIQTFVAAWMNKLMIQVEKYLRQATGYESMITMQVHDALTAEAPEKYVKVTEEIFNYCAAMEYDLPGLGRVKLPADAATVGTYLDQV